MLPRRWSKRNSIASGISQTIFVLNICVRHDNSANKAIPIALVFGQDDIFGRNIGEESDRRQLTARLPVFIQRVIVIVHLVNSY